MTTDDASRVDADRSAADAVVKFFAWDAVLAWREMEDSLPPGPDGAHDSGTSFERLWNGLGLSQLDLGPEPTESDPKRTDSGRDALRILRAAGDIIQSGDGDLTIVAAIDRAFGRGDAPSGNDSDDRSSDEIIESLRADLTMPGDSPRPLDPEDRLAESLARLGKAAALRDVVRLGASAMPRTEDLEQADALVRGGQRLMAGQSDVADRESAARSARRAFVPAIGTNTVLLFSQSLIEGPVPVKVATTVMAWAAALWVGHSTRRASWDARSALDASRAHLGEVRMDLIATFGSAPRPAPSFGEHDRHRGQGHGQASPRHGEGTSR
jgi:hypothetical protein